MNAFLEVCGDTLPHGGSVTTDYVVPIGLFLNIIITYLLSFLLHLLTVSVLSELFLFLPNFQGFTELIPIDLIKIFDENELEVWMLHYDKMSLENVLNNV